METSNGKESNLFGIVNIKMKDDDNDNNNKKNKKRNITYDDNPNKRRNRFVNPRQPNKLQNFPDDDDDDDDNINNFLMILFPGNRPPNNFNNDDDVANKPTCNNPLCDHTTFEENPDKVDIPDIKEIKHINDLIALGKSYHCKKNTEFAGMDLKLMCDLVKPLTKLHNMIGMSNVKENIVDQIVYFLQGFYKKQKCGDCSKCAFDQPCDNIQNDMMHTAISGSPGTGKTELGKILGEMYKAMGILSKGTFKSVSRSDLIGEYLGHTAVKTQKVIDECKGGVLFIDEAYSLGNKELRDSFSKECIDTLNKNLSERRDFLCIIAGYKDELEKCFFKYNAGLNRRFTFRYDISPYDHKELFKIFEDKVIADGWNFYYENDENKDDEKQKIEALIKKNHKGFPNFGGDVETFLFKCKMCHSRRCLFEESDRKVLSFNDIENGLKLLVEHRKNKDKSSSGANIYCSN